MAMWKAGTITGNTLYCREEFKEWVPLRTMVRDQRRIYIRLAPPPENAAYTFHCF